VLLGLIKSIVSPNFAALDPPLWIVPNEVLWVCVCITAVPIIKLFSWGEGDSGGHVLRETTSRGLCGLVRPSNAGTREEPGTLTQGGALFSLVPLVWESNPKLQGGWCKPNHQPIGGSDPNHQRIWSPPRAGLGASLGFCDTLTLFKLSDRVSTA